MRYTIWIIDQRCKTREVNCCNEANPFYILYLPFSHVLSSVYIIRCFGLFIFFLSRFTNILKKNTLELICGLRYIWRLIIGESQKPISWEGVDVRVLF